MMKQNPIITRIIAKQFNLAFTNGDWNKVREIFRTRKLENQINQ